MVPSIAAALARAFPQEDVDYLNSLARMFLTITIATAAIVYISRGGQLLRMAPTP